MTVPYSNTNHMDYIQKFLEQHSTPTPRTVAQRMPDNLPRDLAGLGLERAELVVNHRIDELTWVTYENDIEWRHHVKLDLARNLASEILNRATFTVRRDPTSFEQEIFARVVVLTPKQFSMLIERVR